MSVSTPDHEMSEIGSSSARDGSTGCPLCNAKNSHALMTITSDQLFRAWEELGVKLSAEALGDLPRMSHVSLWRCGDCGFDYSHLDQAGGGLFYEELQRQLPNYYPTHLPEYERAIGFAREHKLAEVLDVGCGSGAFLNLAKKAGLRTYGVELNPVAAEAARASGHTIYNELLHEIITRGNHPRFEFVTTWQVLEHVPDPVSFFRDCSRFVRPGGYLAVAVPAEDGINSLSPYNPHVWPPHHVTRWRLKHLRQLGTGIGLKFVEGGNDPMDPYNARYMWELHNKLSTIFNYRRYPGGGLFPKLAAALTSRTKIHKVLPNWGHSTYAFFTAA